MIKVLKAVFLFAMMIVITFTSVAAQSEVVADCTKIVDHASNFEGDLLVTGNSGDTKNLLLIDNIGNLQLLGQGYYSIHPFYNPVDQTILIWIAAATNQEEPVSEEPDTLEMWSLVTNELLATYFVPSNYLPLQRLLNGQLIVFDWRERVFLAMTVQQDLPPETEVLVTENDLPDVSGVSQAQFSYAEFAFSPDLHYVAYKVRGLSLAIYDLQLGEEVWRSPEIPEGIEAMSQPVWNSTSDTLAAALFVEEEMQLFLIDPVTGEETQLTDFPPDPHYGEPGMIRPGSHLGGITWSPDDRYITFTHAGEGLYLFDTQTNVISQTCLNTSPLFWTRQNDYLIVNPSMTSPVEILDIARNEAFSLVPDVSQYEILGFSSYPIDSEEN